MHVTSTQKVEKVIWELSTGLGIIDIAWYKRCNIEETQNIGWGSQHLYDTGKVVRDIVVLKKDIEMKGLEYILLYFSIKLNVRPKMASAPPPGL